MVSHLLVFSLLLSHFVHAGHLGRTGVHGSDEIREGFFGDIICHSLARAHPGARLALHLYFVFVPQAARKTQVYIIAVDIIIYKYGHHRTASDMEKRLHATEQDGNMAS